MGERLLYYERAATALALEFIEIAKTTMLWMPHRHTGWIEPSYPYFDEELVQFMLAIPFRQKIRPGLTRYIQRQALAGVVPGATLMRTEKTSGTPNSYAALRREWDDISKLLGDDMRLGKIGLVDVGALRADVAKARAGFGKGLGWLWRVLAAEQWLRGNWG